MFMKLKSPAVCGLLFLWAAFSAAKAQSAESQGREEQKEPAPQWYEGFVLDPMFSPGSLDALIANSKLIVKVTVISAYPSTGGIGRDSPLVSTDFILEPQRVLKGQFAAERFVVNQMGGQVEGRASERPKTYIYYTGAYPGGLMQPGQQYVLFLSDPDRRLPQRDGLERFDTTLGFFGVVRVEQDKVELSRELRWRGSYTGMSAAQFMDEIATKAPLLGPMSWIDSQEMERLGIINSGAQ